MRTRPGGGVRTGCRSAPRCQADGTVRFRLWAPSHPEVSVVIDGSASMPMQAVGDGWHELVTDRAHAGTRYQFVLPDGLRVPDPASRFQPEDVHGPSEVIDPAAYAWSDMAWRGRPWEEAVVYELHIGTFTPEGTFRAAIGKLDHLVAPRRDRDRDHADRRFPRPLRTGATTACCPTRRTAPTAGPRT